MNFMESPFPYSLRVGFWVFLQSERVRHLEDVKKIDAMIIELEKITPVLKHGDVRDSLLRFSKKFVGFDF